MEPLKLRGDSMISEFHRPPTPVGRDYVGSMGRVFVTKSCVKTVTKAETLKLLNG